MGSENNKIIKFNNREVERLGNEGPWDLLICGIDPSDNNVDSRMKFLSDKLVATKKWYFCRDKKHRESFQLIIGKETQVITRETQVITWPHIEDKLIEFFPKDAKNILLDISSLELEAILYFFQALINLRLPISKLSVAYTVPENYKESETSLNPEKSQSSELKDSEYFQQPKGYVALPALNPESYAHIIFLGFTKGRAYRFIDHYECEWKNIVAFYGNPPSVTGGVGRVKKANKLCFSKLEELGKKPIGIPAHDPFETKRRLKDLFQNKDLLDIVPLGPKPFTLGVLLFYFDLTEEERAKVRLLYDNPRILTKREGTVKEIYYYSCDELLKCD